MAMLHKIPQCPQCRTQMGLQVAGPGAAWICPRHGAQAWIETSKLNGCYDEAKIGGTQ